MKAEIRAQRALDNACEFARNARKSHPVGEKLGTGRPITDGESRRIDSYLEVYDAAQKELEAAGDTRWRKLDPFDRERLKSGYRVDPVIRSGS